MMSFSILGWQEYSAAVVEKMVVNNGNNQHYTCRHPQLRL